jgi:hypothetical protein
LQGKDSRHKVKAKVHQDSGKLGIEFTIDKTLTEFKKGAKKINLNYAHSFVEFEKVLQGQYKTAWNQVLHENFLELTNLATVPAKQDCLSKAKFFCTMELFIQKTLHEKKPRDWQYIYMIPSGDYNIKKKIKTSPIDHLHQWEDMMRMAGLLPTGNIKTSSASLQVVWFYMTFHKLGCTEYVQSGCKLRNKTP